MSNYQLTAESFDAASNMIGITAKGRNFLINLSTSVLHNASLDFEIGTQVSDENGNMVTVSNLSVTDFNDTSLDLGNAATWDITYLNKVIFDNDWLDGLEDIDGETPPGESVPTEGEPNMFNQILSGGFDPVAIMAASLGIQPTELTPGGRVLLSIIGPYIPFLGIIGLDAVTLNEIFSDDSTKRSSALSRVGNSVSNLDTIIDTVSSPLGDVSESAADLLGNVVSGLLGKMDPDDTKPFPEAIDGSTGLIRILGEVGRFMDNFDKFAELMTGVSRDGKMSKSFVDNLDILMGNALTYIEGALKSKADAAQAARDAEAAEAAAAEITSETVTDAAAAAEAAQTAADERIAQLTEQMAALEAALAEVRGEGTE